MRILSLDQLLEEAITGIYRAWYTLPRRSTLPPIDKLRSQLADRLESLPRPVDLTAYEQAMIDFAAALLDLPGAAEAGGAALADLAEAVPSAERQAFSTLLRKTDASPARLALLVELLRLSNPPQALIASLVYAPAEAPEIWNAIWGVLEKRRADLPEAERAQIDAIRAEWEAAQAAAAGARQSNAATLSALQALETVPAAVRVAWQVFFAYKYPGEAPVYLHAAPESFEHLAMALPDMAAAAAMPPSPEETIVDFFTDVRFPARVKRGEVQWLTVQLTLEAAAESIVAEKAPVQFGPSEEGRQPPPEYVEVRLVAAGFTELTGIWERTILVYPQRDSQPAVFLLSADKLGARRLSLDFLHKGRMIANAAFQCEVIEGSTQRGTEPIELEEKPEVAPLATNPPPPADLELRVARTAEANGLSFVLSSTLAEVPYRSQPVGQITLNEKNPQAFFTNRLMRLSELAAGLQGGGDERLIQEIESLGEGLFERLMPPELQAAYWEQIKPLVDKGVIKTLLINSDEPWIPWELVKPYRWNDADDSEQKAGFLVEQFTLSRWLARPLPPGVEVKQAALVMPNLNLIFVQKEKAFFDEFSKQERFDLQGPLQARDEVIDSLRAGDFQLMHFATHGAFDETNAEQSELSLVDGSLTPADLMGSDLRGVRTARPMIFLNACHSGQVALSLTGLGGWADKFFREARASAFVGTLWEVNDELAAEFARSFYSELAQDLTLGEAVRKARLHIRDKQPSNPTWLAYALYGDPNGRVTFG